MEKVAFINGANMNRLGVREPDIYGSDTLADVVERAKARGGELGLEVLDFQSNHEGEIIDAIEKFADFGVKFGVINPGAFTHTSVAIRDCIAGSGIKFVEVHISNVAKREDFRKSSYMTPVCEAVVAGMGVFGYEAALEFISKISK